MPVILTVEDETLVRDYLSEILERAGYQVVSAANQR
jgi:CheY-like chemotaxis protein